MWFLHIRLQSYFTWLFFMYFLLNCLCRCREKQRKEASRLQTVNRKLSAMNKLLMEENDRLQKQVSHLVYENGYMKQQIHTVSVRYYSFFICLFFWLLLLFQCSLNALKMFVFKSSEVIIDFSHAVFIFLNRLLLQLPQTIAVILW